jgi:lipopolysaccharide exporter
MLEPADSGSEPPSEAPGAPPSLRSRVLRGGMWIFAARFTSRVLGLASLMILARVLVPDDFGLMGIGLIVIETLELFSETGFEQALVQRKGQIEEFVDTAWTVTILRGFLLGGFVLLVAPVIGLFFDDDRVAGMLQVLALSPVVKGFANAHVVSFARDLEFDKRFLLNGGGALIQATVAVTIAVLAPSVWALVFGLLAGNLGRVILSFLLTDKRPRLSYSGARFRTLFSYGRWILGSKVLMFLSTQGDDILVGKLLGADVLGYYRLSYRISNMPATELATIVSTAVFPAFAKVQDDFARLRRAFLQTFELTTVVSFLFGGLILVLADVLVSIVLGEKWISIVPLVRILCIYGMMRSMGASYGSVFQALGRPDLITKIQLFNLAVLAAVIFPMTMRWGVVGVAGAVVAASAGAAPVNIWLILKVTETPAARLANPVVRAVFYLVVCLGSPAAVRFFLAGDGSPTWAVVAAVSGGLLYLTLWARHWRNSRSEIWGIVRQLLPPRGR